MGNKYTIKKVFTDKVEPTFVAEVENIEDLTNIVKIELEKLSNEKNMQGIYIGKQ